MRRAKGLRDRIFKALGKIECLQIVGVIGKLKREGRIWAAAAAQNCPS